MDPTPDYSNYSDYDEDFHFGCTPAQKLPPPVRLPPPAVAPRRAQEASSEADEPATPLLAAGAPVNMSRLKRMYGDGEPGRVLYPP